MKLILIDDDCLVVSALKMILENEPDFEVAATAEDGQRSSCSLPASTDRMCF